MEAGVAPWYQADASGRIRQMRMVAIALLGMLSACGGGGTSGTNYSDPPPMAEIVATPAPSPTPSAAAEAAQPAEAR
jgi:hypothetical protein